MNKYAGLNPPDAVIVIDLFPEVLDGLIALLSGLVAADWEKPTACAGWSVKDVALHILGVEISNLSRRRDAHLSGTSIDGWEELVTFLNRWNEEWVQVARRISAPLLVDLLQFTGEQMIDYFQSLDPYAMGDPVSWAGEHPAPVWLDLAREYTERWHHQQHIRDAISRPGFQEPRFLTPILATFVRALPRSFEHVMASEGTIVTLTVGGGASCRWSVVRETNRWMLYTGAPEHPEAEVILDENLAWRIFTRGLNPDQAREHITLRGDPKLGWRILETVSIIA